MKRETLARAKQLSNEIADLEEQVTLIERENAEELLTETSYMDVLPKNIAEPLKQFILDWLNTQIDLKEDELFRL